MKKTLFILFYAITFYCNAQQKIILTTGDTLMGTLEEIDEDHSRIIKPDGTSAVILSNLIKNREEVIKWENYKPKGFQKGYIIMRESGDTIKGLVKVHSFMGWPVEWVDFAIKDSTKKKPYRADSIIGVKYNSFVYKYFNYCGWSKLIQDGSIKVFKGYIVRSKTTAVCLAFKKDTLKAKFVASDEVKIFTGKLLTPGGILTDKVKKYFKDYIADNPELLAEFEKETFRYEDLEGLILKYNEWAKKNKK